MVLTLLSHISELIPLIILHQKIMFIFSENDKGLDKKVYYNF